MGHQRLINVSNRLPVTVGADDQIKKSSGGLVAALEGITAGAAPSDEGGGGTGTGGARPSYDLRWLGWPGGDIPDPGRRREVEGRLEREFGCTPVFLTAAEAEGHYEGFSNSSLWPLLHYMPSRFRYEQSWWDHYERVNRRFADRVLSVARDGDLVWVHDYQLMLLPRMVKEARPGVRVGFFLHTPFPSYEVFRYHPRRAELVSGVLGADQVGFHTFGYLRHFRSAVLRLLGIESEFAHVRHEGRDTVLGVYPIGINAARFAAQLDAPEHAKQVGHFRQNFQGKRIVISVERMDYTKGILHRLDAIDLFLAGCDAAQRDQIKFIFVSVPSREKVEEYQELRAEVEARVGRLNGRYATLNNSPIHFIHGSVTFAELCALYALADVSVVTPLIDGMNLVAKEYVAAQRDDPAGVLILSEFAGAAEELLGALIVNPHDTRAAADALAHALAMPPEERRARMEPMRQRVTEFDARAWAESFVSDLAARPVNAEPAEAPRAEEAARQVAETLSRGGRVAMFLDYDGTLRELERDPAAARPHARVRALLDRLRGQENLDVTVISGRTPQDLESFLGQYPFGLIAEHGANIRRAGSGEWEELDRDVNYGWKPEILKVLRLYQTSTPGSHIEDKRTSVVWHYRRADPEFGSWKAKELVDELGAITANEPVVVRHGNKIVEVTASQVNKGAAVLRLLQQAPHPDLVLVAGDDTTDESMFRLDVAGLLSVKVGDAPDTHARYRLPTPAAFRRFLEQALGDGH